MLAQLIGPDGAIVVAVVALLLIFGGSRLPKLARGLGSASHEFRQGLIEGQSAGAQASEPSSEERMHLS